MPSPRPTVWALAACVALAACADEARFPAGHLGPSLSEAGLGGPGLAVYGIGLLRGAVPAPCTAAGHAQFDFWLGQWNIVNPQGQPAGTSIITRELHGCVVMEDFQGVGGVRGRSLNVYDRDLDRWFQSFQDAVLPNFRIAGGLVGDEMVMTGSQRIFHFPTGTFRQRDTKITWTPNPDGSVRQFIQNSFDGGPVQPGFDGLYIAADELDRPDEVFIPFCQNVVPGFRQLDFWIGRWAVSATPGPALGTSEVRADLNGCLIEENFESPMGYQSRSFAFYDFAEDRWFRSFADNEGEHVELSGGLADGKMVMTGTDVAPDGRAFLVRVTIEPVGDGVRQTWETSHDGGASWRRALALGYAGVAGVTE